MGIDNDTLFLYIINVIRNPINKTSTEMDINERSELEKLFESQTGWRSRDEILMDGGWEPSEVVYADEYVEWLEAQLNNR
jgi:hypothetical protein